ncbi:hypothetical protein NBRC116589_13650 [Ruegeria sp. HU-ET01832]|uniref:hypothetical protein n=1 Tax=Ruegeria sp. HU-ET01832 TaxID=3135906 RepID=UPI0031049AA4
MDDKFELHEFFHVWKTNDDCPTDGILLYNPYNEDEYVVRGVDNAGFEVSDANGAVRKLLRQALSNWIVIVPRDHALHNLIRTTKTPADERREIINELSGNGLPVVSIQNLDHLRLVRWAWTTQFSRTDRETRHKVYSAVKMLENFSEHWSASIKIGRRIVEHWASQVEDHMPADLLIHLAYYRRWSWDTRAALEASDCLVGTRIRRDLTDMQRSILATERAAAFMDLFERSGSGLEDAELYLKYSQGASKGKNSPENYLGWQRYNKLREGTHVGRC